MTDADRAVIANATNQYRQQFAHISQVIKAGEHNPDNLMARLCRDYRLPPTTIIYLANHMTDMMNTELTP